MELAPIILFVYNRPEHTRQTLKALSENPGSERSTLYIFADGPKTGASLVDLEKINHVRHVIRERKWCKDVVIVEREKNMGLAASIISGVTEIIQQHGRAIILEDDIVTAKGFLSFMNDGLRLMDHPKVAGISGWSFDINTQSNYFSRIGSCWGWATWKEHWMNVNFNVSELMNQLSARGLVDTFNADGNYPYFQMLKSQQEKSVDSWAIRFYADYFLKEKLFYYPSSSLVRNIGEDGSGTHSGKTDVRSGAFDFSGKSQVESKVDVYELPEIRTRIIKSSLYRKESPTRYQRLVSVTKRFANKIFSQI